MPGTLNDMSVLKMAGCACVVAGGLLANMVNHVGAFLVSVTHDHYVTLAEAKTRLSTAWTAYRAE